MAGKTLLGKLDRSAFGILELPRLPPEVLQGFLALEDLTGTTSDALDQFGTVSKTSRLGEIEAHNLAQPGDVLVIQGVVGISSMGGISASIGKRQGEAGAIVDGAVRDIDHSRRIGYPVWSSGVSPITGKWRIETVAVNQPVRIAGIEVRPGDLVVADECGVCFVPHGRAEELLTVARRLAQSEEERLAKLAGGMPLAQFAAMPRKD
jgi:4-hydroxy-4-methyl-2-oxoglutarate aldolase